MTVAELAEKCNRSRQAIYLLAKRLGRLPTEEEVIKRKAGRPKKYYKEK